MAIGLAANGLTLVGSARAELAISVENGNDRGRVDHFEIYDVVCSQQLGLLALAGQTSGTIGVCGGLGQVGEVRIRYDGETEWSDYPELHSWSVIILPERPRSRRRPPADD